MISLSKLFQKLYLTKPEKAMLAIFLQVLCNKLKIFSGRNAHCDKTQVADTCRANKVEVGSSFKELKMLMQSTFAFMVHCFNTSGIEKSL